MMFLKFIALAGILTLGLVLQAQTPKTTTVEGYIIDNMCAGDHAKEAGFGEKVKKHPTSCALMDSCVSSGYAVFTSDAKLYKFDADGNAKAIEFLKATKTKAGLAIVIEGTVDGDQIKVTKITEKS
jgi:hypothetical protein